MINRSFFFILTLVFLIGNTSSGVASNGLTTHTQLTPELKPASLDKSYKVASVCFLGVGECDPSNNFDINSSNQCLNEGYVSSCPSGQKLNKNGRCPYDDSYGSCCAEKCPDNSSTSCSGSVVADDGCGYQCKSCDPCPGYHDCGGTWQYCTGTTCYADSTRCSVSCKSDYFPNKCDNKSDCKGIYRNGYCSGDCTPACVESCFGDSSPKTGEGWTYSTCTTCSGITLYNNSAKSCPSGYSTTVDSCDTASGYRLSTSGKSGDSVCGKCTNSSCPDGYSTTVTSCQTGYSLVSSGKSGGQVCRKCECKLTATSCPDAYEPTQSCVKKGTTYYKCELCHRTGGSAEGLYYCYHNDGRPSYGFTPVPTVSVVCGNKNYRTSCGCETARFLNRPDISSSGFVGQICGERGYRGNYVNHESWYYRGFINDACEENNRNVGFNKCAAYSCAESGYKVVDAPYDTCGVNQNLCCCPEGFTGEPNSTVCKKVVGQSYIP